MMPASVCTRTQSTLANSSVRKVSIEIVRPDAGGVPSRRNRVNFFELAYQRIEDLLVNCELKPGRFLTVQELQTVTGFGRTPVHNAVNQFAADTLIIIRGRNGLQIAPIDLARERARQPFPPQSGAPHRAPAEREARQHHA